jgi:Flp pilus assembly protein TadD
LAPTSERRSTFLAGLPRSGGTVLADVLVGWLRLESDADAVRELASALARVAPSDVVMLTREGVRLRKAGRNAAAATVLRAALDAAASPSAAPPASESLATMREELCRALSAEGGGESLAEGLRQAQVLVSSRPDDWRIRLLRGEFLQRSGRPAEAAADWIAAIESAGGALGDERRTWERRCLLAYVDGGNPAAAKALLDRLAPASDRDFLAAAGRVEAAVGRRKEAASKYRNALRAPGPTDDAMIRLRLAEVLTESPLAADREEYLKILRRTRSRFHWSRTGKPRRITSGGRGRSTSRSSRCSPRCGAAQRRRRCASSRRSRRPRCCPWLFAGLNEAQRRNASIVVVRRLETIRLVIPEFAAAFPPISADSNADAWNRQVQAAAQWWADRPW